MTRHRGCRVCDGSRPQKPAIMLNADDADALTASDTSTPDRLRQPVGWPRHAPNVGDQRAERKRACRLPEADPVHDLAECNWPRRQPALGRRIALRGPEQSVELGRGSRPVVDVGGIPGLRPRYTGFGRAERLGRGCVGQCGAGQVPPATRRTNLVDPAAAPTIPVERGWHCEPRRSTAATSWLRWPRLRRGSVLSGSVGSSSVVGRGQTITPPPPPPPPPRPPPPPPVLRNRQLGRQHRYPELTGSPMRPPFLGAHPPCFSHPSTTPRPRIQFSGAFSQELK